MTISESESKSNTHANPNNRGRTGTLNPNCRVVYVAVPKSVFNHAKAQAYLSGLSWTKFVEKLLTDSKPLR